MRIAPESPGALPMTPLLRRLLPALLVLAALAALPSAAAADGPYEPNNSFAQAHGPLTGGREYVAAQETQNDPDYFFFNTSGQRQLDIDVRGIVGLR